MKSLIHFGIIILISFQISGAQELISATYKGMQTKQQIATSFALPLIRNGAKYYHIKYTSKDARGNKDTLSGLMVVPDDLKFEYPRLVYQHGTSDCKQCVPSRYGVSGGEEGQLGLLFAGLGFVAILPDFVGMGDGRGFQTYVHAATIVSATTDMLAASASWLSQNQVFTNDQLFITGYSQGGYASMALHKHMEESFGSSYVTAAAHLSGPYSLSGVMRDLILSETEYLYPAYIPNTMLGFNEVYEIYNELSEVFKPEYVADIKKYYEGSVSLSSLNSKLIQLLKTNTGASVGGRMLKDDLKSEIVSYIDHPVNRILKENDLYNWAPKALTRIFYCKADDQVPFMNSVVAKDTMLAKGATNLVVTDVNSSANHGGCVTPALTQTLFFFLGLQKITSDVKYVKTERDVFIYPNPVGNVLTIGGLTENQTIMIFNIQGQVIQTKLTDHSGLYLMDVSELNSGIYFLLVRTQDDKLLTHRFIRN